MLVIFIATGSITIPLITLVMIANPLAPGDQAVTGALEGTDRIDLDYGNAGIGANP